MLEHLLVDQNKCVEAYILFYKTMFDALN